MALDGMANEDPIPEETRIGIVNGLWHDNTTSKTTTELHKWQAYFHYYTAECRTTIGYENGEHTFVRKHKDITKIAKQLEDGKSKKEVKELLYQMDTQQRSLDIKDRMAEGSVRMVARLISMVDIGPIPYGIRVRTPIAWEDENLSLKEFLSDHFKESFISAGKIKFDENFTALNLHRFTGLRVRPTNNLVDHLQLLENDTELCIFPHVTFLEEQQNSAIFPSGLAKETLRTLALLFPRNIRDIEKAFDSEWFSPSSSVYLDLELLKFDRVTAEGRQAESFKYWRDELVSLKAKFDEPNYHSISNLWHDGRNKVSWYTFWVAIAILFLTIFFGLIQSIEGALQVYKAYHPS